MKKIEEYFLYFEFLEENKKKIRNIFKPPHLTPFQVAADTLAMMTKAGKLKTVMKHLPTLIMLKSLLAHTPGRHIRRSAYGGIFYLEES